jgi:hypothetical protein
MNRRPERSLKMPERKLPYMVKCAREECGKEFLKTEGGRRYCSDECAAFVFDDGRARFVIFSRDRFTCIYCGTSATHDFAELHLDHVVPFSMGGASTADNLVTACKRCNSEKGNRELGTDLLAEILTEIRRRNTGHSISPKLKIRAGRG